MFQNLFNWYIIIVGLFGLILIIVNYLLVETSKMDENMGTSLDYLEKSNPFECGFDSFKQSSNPVPVPFILIALLFLPFDLEISIMLPFITSMYTIQSYGLFIFIIFLIILFIGFFFELKSNALKLTHLFKFNSNSYNKYNTFKYINK